MDTGTPPPETPTEDTRSALSPRALISGFALVLLFAIICPINDWLLKNTFLYSQHLAIGVTLFVVVMGAVINPLLGRHRYRAKEMMVMVAMLLVLGGVASSGLSRLLPPILSGPAKVLPSSAELAPYVDNDGEVLLPKGPYIGMPEHGLPNINDPEYRYVIDGYHQGFGAADPSVTHRATVTWTDSDGVTRTQLALAAPYATDNPEALDLSSPIGRALLGQRAPSQVDGPLGSLSLTKVEPPAIPWGIWLKGFLAWIPLLGSAMTAFLAMSALVRRQWIHNERLTYPIGNVLVNYLQDPQPGKRSAAVFRSKAFWVAFSIVALWLLSQPLKDLGILPVSMPTKISLRHSFDSAPFNLGYADWGYLNPTIYFSIIGLAFFLPADISFSVWFCFIFGNAVYALCRQQGIAVDGSMPSKVSMGGWFVECLLIIWIGRRYYLQLLRAAFVSSDDPDLREMRPITWAFLASALGMVVAMTALGAQFGSACIAALVYLGLGLVLGRLVAEAGLPFIQTPMFWSASNVIYSLTGLAAPLAALVPLTMLAQTLCADPREHLVPFAVNAEFLVEKANVRRRSWLIIALVVVSGGTLVAGACMLWCGYAHDGQQNMDSWWKVGPFLGTLGQGASHALGGDPIPSSTYTAYAVGGIMTAGLGIARLAWAWWPIHPLGFLVMASYPLYRIWFGFFLGWLAKALVMRYGGMQLYNRLKPVALGLIAGEAVIAGVFLIIGLIAGLVFGYKLPFNTRFLAG
jgi:hypothetical protein